MRKFTFISIIILFILGNTFLSTNRLNITLANEGAKSEVSGSYDYTCLASTSIAGDIEIGMKVSPSILVSETVEPNSSFILEDIRSNIEIDLTGALNDLRGLINPFNGHVNHFYIEPSEGESQNAVGKKGVVIPETAHKEKDTYIPFTVNGVDTTLHAKDADVELHVGEIEAIINAKLGIIPIDLPVTCTPNEGVDTLFTTVKVEEPDTEPPVITLIGDNPVELEIGEPYVEPGATAEDNVDGDVTSQIEITGNVDTDKLGTYEVVYTVSDAANNKTSETRTINVVDRTAPVITLIGDNPTKLEVGESYVESGATAEDNVDGNVSDRIEISGTVDTSVAGEYTITYTVSDLSGNVSDIKRKVIVEEPTEPIDPTDPGEGDGDGEEPTDPGEGDGDGDGEEPTNPTDPGEGDGDGEEPTNPTDPGEGDGDGEEPTDPTDPGDGDGEEPTDPTDPGEGDGDGEEPTDPTDPGEGDGDGEEPTDPTDPGDGDGDGEEPTEPTDPGEGDGDGEEPTDPTDPGEGDGDGEEPTDPTDPGEGEDDGEEPTEPTDPGEGDGEEPTDPTDPGEGDGDGEEPMDPTDPGEGEGDGEEPTDPGEGDGDGDGEEPTNPTDPTAPGDVMNGKGGPSVGVDKSTYDDHTLPKTATNNPTIIALGFLVVLFGSILLFLTRRNKTNQR